MRIFLSYGHDEHRDFAMRLAEAFDKRSYKVWFDEKDLKVGAPWEERIEEGLKGVAQDVDGCMVLVMTPHSVRRPDGYCLNELAYALDLHLPVIPIMLVWTTPPLSIYRYQWLDLTHFNSQSSTFEADFSKIIEAVEKKKCYQDENQSTIERLLEPLDYSSDIKYFLPSFTGRQWLFEDVDKWLHDKDGSRIYLLTGLPGVGKTAIAIKMIQTYNNVAAYHLIRRGDSEKTSLRRAICNIAFQLSKQLPEYYERLIRVNIYRELNRCNDLALFEALVSVPLSYCQHRTDPLLIVIDAMDESIVGSTSNFAQLISNTADKLPKWVRFVLTSRPEEAILLPLQAFHPHILKPEVNENNSDIRTYIEKRVKEMYGEDTAIDCTPIVEKSEGIFLYAKYVCDEFLPEDEDEFTLSNLPAGISAVYYDFFSRNYPDISVYRKNIRPILEVLIAQIEPFTIEHLADCLSIDEDDIEDFLSAFHTLFTLDVKHRIHPFHSSLFDWLSKREQAGPYSVKQERGASVIAEWLYNKFEVSKWNFFNDKPMGLLLETWIPEILEKTDCLHFDSRAVLSSYINQVHEKGILQDLVANRRRFHFIKSVLKYVFRQPDCNKEVLEDTISHCGVDLGRHKKGLMFLCEYAQSGKLDLPQKDLCQSEYYYYLDVQIPMLYVQSSFDPDYTFKVLADGLTAAYDDGRVDNINHILCDIYKLATTTFSDSAPVAVKYLMEASEYIQNDGDWSDKWGKEIERCAMSIKNGRVIPVTGENVASPSIRDGENCS